MLIPRIRHKQSVRLAVVGTVSSGKSFLLKDIIDAFSAMGYSYYTSDTLAQEYGFKHTPFTDYSPNQNGSNGGTPLYACRHSDHYGQLVRGEDVAFDLSFLNIPGEIFTRSKLNNYNVLKEKLSVDRRLFTVFTYESPSGIQRLIVKPQGSPENDKGLSTTLAAPGEPIMRFKSWSEIHEDLERARFTCRNQRDITGEKLLANFFKYDTDSVMRSIHDLIAQRVLTNLKFDETEFESEQHDLSFVFFHYCALATDIIICDRIYIPPTDAKDNNTYELPFGELTEQLASFLSTHKAATKVNTYLAFRNVDFIIREKEDAYIDLIDELSRLGIPQEQIRNSVYSLFSYLLSDLIGQIGPEWKNTPLNHILGTSANLQDLIPDEIQELRTRFIDLDGSDGVLHNDDDDLKAHIKSVIGGNGQGFQKVLSHTGWAKEGTSFVPHVHYTCTPITEDFKIYRNGRAQDHEDEFDFYRDGSKVKFSDRNSKACFGSYQLCMDIMEQHEIGDFSYGAMLQRIINLS